MSPLQRTLRDPEQLYERRLGPCLLYLDDIDVIHKALEKASHEIHMNGDPFGLALSMEALAPEERREFLRVLDKVTSHPASGSNGSAEHRCLTIRAGSANADEVVDLRDAEPSEIKDLQLWIQHPHVGANLGLRSARAWTSGRDTDARALVDAIADYVAKRRSIGAALVIGARDMWKYWILLVSTSALSFMAVSRTVPTDEPSTRVFGPVPDYIAAGVLIGTVLWTAMTFATARRFGGIAVIPKRRSESRGLSARQWGSVGLVIISAVVGSLITAWLT